LRREEGGDNDVKALGDRNWENNLTIFWGRLWLKKGSLASDDDEVDDGLKQVGSGGENWIHLE
jgi:hypothetical protein